MTDLRSETLEAEKLVRDQQKPKCAYDGNWE